MLLFFFTISCKNAEYYFQEGNNEARQGNYKLAIEKFKKAIERDSKFKIAYIQEGYCYEDLTQYDAAIKSYQSLLAFDPKNTTALFQIGKCNDDLKKFTDAIEWYNKALISKGYDPADTTMQVIMNWNKEGIIGDTDQGKFDVNSNEIFFNRGLAYYASGQSKKAFVDFKGCIDQGYFVGPSYYMIGIIWLWSKKMHQACEAFSKGSFYGDSLSTIQLSKNGCN